MYGFGLFVLSLIWSTVLKCLSHRFQFAEKERRQKWQNGFQLKWCDSCQAIPEVWIGFDTNQEIDLLWSHSSSRSSDPWWDAIAFCNFLSFWAQNNNYPPVFPGSCSAINLKARYVYWSLFYLTSLALNVPWVPDSPIPLCS